MKLALQHLDSHLDSVNLHAPDFDSGIDSSGDSPATAVKDVSTGPDISNTHQHQGTDPRLPTHCDRPKLHTWDIPPIQFGNIALYIKVKTQTQTNQKMNDQWSSESSTALNWEMKEDQEDNSDKVKAHHHLLNIMIK